MSQAYQAPPRPVPATPIHPPIVQPKSRFQPTTRNPRVAASRANNNRLLVPPSINKSLYFQPERSAITAGRSSPIEFSQPTPVAPKSGIQLYSQRLNALRAGRLYTRLPADSFYEQWIQASGHPSYDQWRKLLTLEARAAARGKGNRPMAVMVGDSLSQWFPVDRLPSQQLWLNQGISGDTTSGILNRLTLFAKSNAETIYLMAGVNDLKRGAGDREILRNINQIIQRLKQQNPNAQIVVQSILPTRSRQIPNERIAKLNSLIDIVAQRQGVNYLDLHQQFSDRDGYMRQEFTTDGIHLSPEGYEQWQIALQRLDQKLAQRPRTIAQAQTLRANL
jgi:lysophospholipase L1-like esterase